MVQEEIADVINLAQTAEGFAQLQSEGRVQEGDTQAAFLARMQRFQDTAAATLSLYQSLNLSAISLPVSFLVSLILRIALPISIAFKFSR